MSNVRAAARLTAPAETGELRDRILRASVELIEEQGLAKLSMREVARRAGVTHQAPYHHFADRAAILGEIAEQGFRLLAAAAQAAIRRRDGELLPFPDRISAMARAYVEFACSHPAHFRIMFRPELVDLDNCPGAQRESATTFALLTDLVRDAVRAGLPATPNDEALVALLWSIAHGLACLILDGPLAKKMPEASREKQIDGVVRGIHALLESRLRDANKGGSRARRRRRRSPAASAKPRRSRAKTSSPQRRTRARA